MLCSVCSAWSISPWGLGQGLAWGVCRAVLAEGCEVGDWELWPECPVTCGKGMRHRQRFYINAELANERGCSRVLTSRQACSGGLKQCPG